MCPPVGAGAGSTGVSGVSGVSGDSGDWVLSDGFCVLLEGGGIINP